MGDHQEDNLVVLNGVVLGAEDVAEDGDRAEPWNAAPVLLYLVFLDAAEDVGLAFAEANRLIDYALAEDRFGDATDGDRSALRSDFDLDLEGDVVIVMDGGRDLDVYADILVLELRIDQRADEGCGRAGLVGAGGDRNPRADLIVAFCWSVARMRGFWRILVL